MAPTYATLVMGYLEKKLYTKYEEIYGSSELEIFIKLFKRFLNDCCILWNKSKESLLQLYELPNSLHPKIKFTMEMSTVKLPFLDILLVKENNELHTDIYYKTTDTHQYLDFKSRHSKHTKYNIPYCLARRICAIVSRKDARQQRLNELKAFLKQQHYPDTIITKGIEKAKSLSIAELRTSKKQQEHKNTLPLVITHNPNNPNIFGIVKENLKFLENSQKLKSILDETKLVISRRQPKNLKQYLTHAKFTSVDKDVPMVKKCGQDRCGTCEHLKSGNIIKFKNGQIWKIRSNMTCKAQNVIYAIICSKCESFYIGQTQNLRNRVTLHKQQIHHPEYRHLTVSEHLYRCSKGKFDILPIYQCQQANRLILESKENEIIKRLKPDLNNNIT